MYTVHMEHECGCFKRSEFESNKSFATQKDAYAYANIAAELMNEEFCKSHHFFSQITDENSFVIRVAQNPNAGSCSTGGGCGTSCGC